MDMHTSRKRLPANCYVVLYGSCSSLYAGHAGVGRKIQDNMLLILTDLKPYLFSYIYILYILQQRLVVAICFTMKGEFR